MLTDVHHGLVNLCFGLEVVSVGLLQSNRRHTAALTDCPGNPIFDSALWPALRGADALISLAAIAVRGDVNYPRDGRAGRARSNNPSGRLSPVTLVFGANRNASLQRVTISVVAAPIGRGIAVGIGAIACPAVVSAPAMAVAVASGGAIARRRTGAQGSRAALNAMHVTLKTATRSSNAETSRTTGSRMSSRTTEARARGKTTAAKPKRRTTTYAKAGRRAA